jgi:hypothetical protein
LKKPFTKKGLVEWLKVKGLSTGKKKKKGGHCSMGHSSESHKQFKFHCYR